MPAQQSLLIDLQLIDNAITSAKNRLARLPEHEQIVAIHIRLENATVELKVIESELADVAIDLRRSEIDVEAVTDRMAKDETRLASGTPSPKELEQLQHELLSLAKRKSELEDSELEIMMRHDGVKERFDELQSDETGLKTLELELNVRIEYATTEIHAEISSKQAERLTLTPQLERPLLDLYEKVRGSADGIGAALLIGNKCDGCHLVINAVELERIKTLAADEVLRCEECRRILVRI